MTEDAPVFGAAPTIHEIADQIKWEMDTVQLGVERYHRAIAGASLGDTDPGLRIMRNILTDRPDVDDPSVINPGLITAIAASREFLVGKLTSEAGSTGKVAPWDWMAQFLTPEKVGVIITRTVMTPDPGARTDNTRLFSATALDVARNIKLEVEYEEWIRTEAALQEADPEYLNIHKLLLARWRKSVDTQVFKRWKRKLQTVQELPWPRAALVQYGAFLLGLLIKYGGGYFTRATTRVEGGKTETRLVLTQEAHNIIDNIHTDLEVTRPYLLPMRCPPKPWRRTNESPAQDLDLSASLEPSQ